MAVKYKRLIALAKSEIWAMRPEHMDILCEVLTYRRAGRRISQEEIAARLAPKREGIDAAYYESDRGERKPYAIERGVAVIPLEGVIMPKASYFDQISGATSLATFQARLAAAIADESVKAVMIEIDSPGGMVLGISEAEKAVRIAAQQKPVHAWIRGLCCSGAYWIASACTQIHAPLTTVAGSIGAYRMHVDQSAADAEIGEKYTYVFAGDRKVDGNPHQPLQGKAKAAWQASIDEVYSLFTTTVMRNRRLSGDVGQATGNGDSFYGETAKRMGLVDTHLSRNEVLEKLGTKSEVRPVAMAGGVFNAESAETQRNIVVDAESLSAAQIILSKTWPMAAIGADQRPTEAVTQLDAAASLQNIQGGEARGSASLAAGERGAAAAATKEGWNMKKELKALLYAAGVIKGLDDDDAQCWERLEGFAAAKGVSFSRDKQDEAITYFTTLARGGALGTVERNSALATQGQDQKEVKASEIARLERERCDEIRARAAILGKGGFVISEAAVQEALDNEWTVGQAVDVWTKQRPADQTERRLTTVNTKQNALQAIQPMVSEAISVLMGAKRDTECKIPQAAHWARKGSMRLAEHFCQTIGLRVEHMDDEEIAKAFLRLSSGPVGERTSFRANSLSEVESYRTDASETFDPDLVNAGGSLPYYGAGSHPNLFSLPAQRFLMDSLKLAKVTYPTWCYRMRDATTLQMSEGVAIAGYGEFDREIDAIAASGGPLTSKKIFYIEPEPYSKTIGLTWQMVMKDQFSIFATWLSMLQRAAARTVNRAAIELLVSNPTMWDNKAMFHTDHFNDITSGGTPSVAQLKKHDTAFGKQVDIDGQTEIIVEPKYLLHPTDIRVEVNQLIEYMKVQTNATVDPTKLGVWAGLEGVCDAMLRSYSAQKWYTVADPNEVPCIQYQYLAGYGEGGKTTTWYDPATETQMWKVKIAFDVKQARWEGIARDAG